MIVERFPVKNSNIQSKIIIYFVILFQSLLLVLLEKKSQIQEKYQKSKNQTTKILSLSPRTQLTNQKLVFY